jgi:hypothetical protein
MKRTGVAAAAAMLLIVLLLCASNSRAQGAVLQGVITNPAGQPVPGLTVSIFHPARGRSNPVITDARGHYIFYAIPVLPGTSYIEAYWGSELIYRGAIQISGSTTWNISLR